MERNKILKKRKRRSKLNLKPSFVDGQLRKQFNLEEARKEFRDQTKQPICISRPLSRVSRKLSRQKSSSLNRPERIMILESKGGICQINTTSKNSSKLFASKQTQESNGWLQRFASAKDFGLKNSILEILTEKIVPVNLNTHTT